MKRWIAVASIGLALAAVFLLRIVAARDLGDLRIEFEEGAGQRLVVMVHGFSGGMESMSVVRDEVRAAFPDADLLTPIYEAGIFSNNDAVDIASRLDGVIERYVGGKSYTDILLVGHSIGALIVRKAYVYGCGYIEDSPRVRPESREWVEKDIRFVLLAGINRGWSIDPAPEHMTRFRKLSYVLGKVLGRFSGTGKLILGTERGAPFVANLRVQWLRLMSDRIDRGVGIPLVVQLLGTVDDVVTRADDVDVAVSKRFVFISIDGANHRTIARPTGAAAQRFGEALTWSRDDLQAKYGTADVGEEEGVTDVVFVMHGIRDTARWVPALGRMIEEYSPSRLGGAERRVRPITDGYDYFSMFEFLIWGDRQKNVRWFMDQYTECLAKYPNARVHFLGHSNGTYVLASALETYKTLEVGNVVFAGSVVPRRYRWNDLEREGRVGEVRNYVSGDDFVVAVFPRLFELLGLSDIGSAGFNGFTSGEGNKREVRYLKGGHSAALGESYTAAIVEFLLHGGEPDPGGETEPHAAGWVTWCSRLCWVIWAALVAIIIAGGCLGVPRVASVLMKRVPRARPLHSRTVWGFAYVALIWSLLNTL